MENIPFKKPPKYPIDKLKCFQITRLQSVAKLNPTKLKISLKYNSILNITYTKIKSNSKKSQKVNRKKLAWGVFFLGELFPRWIFSEGFPPRGQLSGGIFSRGNFSGENYF